MKVAVPIATILAAVVGIAWLAFHPGVLFGVDEGSLTGSLEDHVLDPIDAEIVSLACRDTGDRWRCGPYSMTADWRGCWNADFVARENPRRLPSSATGCVDVEDLIAGPGIDPS